MLFRSTRFTVAQAALASGGQVIGGSGLDTLAAAGSALDLSSTTLSGVEVIRAATSAATVFRLAQRDLVAGGEGSGPR